LRNALAHRRPTGERLRYLGVEVEAGKASGSTTSTLTRLEPVRSA